MTEQEILEMARGAGIDGCAFIHAEDLVFEFGFRKYCEMNQCGNYGANYGCPPDCGTPLAMKEKAVCYSKALVLQTVQPVTDLSDAVETGALKKKHNVRLRAFFDQLEAAGVKGMAIMAGPCSFCSPCAKVSGAPCRFPQKRTSCLSAYGINVAKMCESCGLSWDYGTKHVVFFGIYMMSSIC